MYMCIFLQFLDDLVNQRVRTLLITREVGMVVAPFRNMRGEGANGLELAELSPAPLVLSAPPLPASAWWNRLSLGGGGELCGSFLENRAWWWWW